MIGHEKPETNSITIKPETVSHEAEQFSWVPLPCCSLPGAPSHLFVSSCVSLDNSFPSVRQEPTLVPWKEFPLQGPLGPSWRLAVKVTYRK